MSLVPIDKPSPNPKIPVFVKGAGFLAVIGGFVYCLSQFLDARDVVSLWLSRGWLFGMWFFSTAFCCGFLLNRGVSRLTLKTIFVAIGMGCVMAVVDGLVPKPIATANNAATNIPDITLQVIRDIDSYIAGKDESGLKIMFGTDEMLAANIRYERDRILHFQKTGKLLSWWDYSADGTIDFAIDKAPFKQMRGSVPVFDNDPNRVYVLIVPKRYTDGKNSLSIYENSIGLPTSVSIEVKGLRDALQNNENTLMTVLDEAMRQDKRYFLQYEDVDSTFFHLLDQAGMGRFQALKPKTDAIREAARSFLRIK